MSHDPGARRRFQLQHTAGLAISDAAILEDMRRVASESGGGLCLLADISLTASTPTPRRASDSAPGTRPSGRPGYPSEMSSTSLTRSSSKTCSISGFVSGGNLGSANLFRLSPAIPNAPMPLWLLAKGADRLRRMGGPRSDWANSRGHCQRHVSTHESRSGFVAAVPRHAARQLRVSLLRSKPRPRSGG